MDPKPHKKSSPDEGRPRRNPARIVLGAGVGSVTVLIVTLAIVWYARDIILLAFAGVLLAVFLQTVSHWLSSHTLLPYRAALVVVVVLMLFTLILTVGLLGARIAEETTALGQTLPASVDKLKQQLQQTDWGAAAIKELPPIGELVASSTALAQLTGASLTALNALTALVVVLFVGFYTAAAPEVYIQGIIHLAPVDRRPRAREVLALIGYNLRRWVLGHLVAMVVVGVACGVGLWLLGVPHALILGLFAFLAELIPYLGPIMAAIPAILLGWSQDTSQALWVIALYCGVHLLEGYLVIPLVYERAIKLPPALTVLGVLLFGLLAGILGAVVATPLLLVLMVLVKALYVQDTLGDTSIVIPGDEQARRQR